LSKLVEDTAKRIEKAENRSLIERAAERADDGRTDTGSADAQSAARKSGSVTDIGSTATIGSGAAPAYFREPLESKYAEVDLTRISGRRIVSPNGKRSRVSEEFRVIKRQILRKASSDSPDAVEHGNLIMVTSAAPGEGKTFTAVSLAISIASEKDKSVLLVDADLHKPGVLAAFGIEAEMGLVDFLEDESLDLSEVLIRTSIPGLTVLPAGRRHKMGAELIASRAMGNLVTELAQRYADRIVIFDMSPVLATSEASALVANVGQVVFVIEAERTTEAEIRAALEMLRPCKNIGLVLNKTQGKSSAADFGSYYDVYYDA
jgi:receptor protein-tyrosine kinase